MDHERLQVVLEIAGCIGVGVMPVAIWIALNWLARHWPVSRRRYLALLKRYDVILNHANYLGQRLDQQPRDPAAGKFCKRGG